MYFEGARKIQQELLEFTAACFQQDVERGQELMATRDLNEALRVQRDWLQDSSERYREEVQRLMDLVSQTTDTTLSLLFRKDGDERT